MQSLEELINAIHLLEQEREQIYSDDKVTPQEHPRLGEIERELARLWDLRRRIEAARAAGLSSIPVPPPANPEQLEG